MRFLDWEFDADFLTATHAATGGAIRFTRAERILLRTLSSRRNRIWTREALLDAVSGLDSSAADRSIDFLINRLRRKLGDAAREPRYIQTRYGEGYVWLADPTVTKACSAGAFLVVGPVRGLHAAGALTDRGEQFLQGLAHEMTRQTTPGRRIALDPECPPVERFPGDKPQFAVTVHFLQSAEQRLDCVLTLRHFATSTILHVSRHCIHAVGDGPESEAAPASHAAQALLSAVWSAQTSFRGVVPSEAWPLPVQMHASTEMFVAAPDTGPEMERRIREALKENPNDHDAQLRLAAVIHGRYVLVGHILLRGPDRRQADEAEMERLVTAALPHLKGNDLLIFTAGKLLYFLNAAYRPLALDLAERALEKTTAVTAGCATVAQLRAWSGRIDDGIGLYDQCLALPDRPFIFDSYLRILKSEALLAAGRTRAAARVMAPLYQNEPHMRPWLCINSDLSSELDVAEEQERALGQFDERAASAQILARHYISARLFENPLHRRNILHWPARLFLERFGPECIADEVRPDLPPGLLTQVQAARRR